MKAAECPFIRDAKALSDDTDEDTTTVNPGQGTTIAIVIVLLVVENELYLSGYNSRRAFRLQPTFVTSNRRMRMPHTVNLSGMPSYRDRKKHSTVSIRRDIRDSQSPATLAHWWLSCFRHPTGPVFPTTRPGCPVKWFRSVDQRNPEN